MSDRPVHKLDYEQDIYIKKLLSSDVEKLSKMDQPEKAWNYLACSLVDENGKALKELTPEFIGENFTSDWVQALFHDIVIYNAPKKKANSQQKKRSGTS